eukprot:TRINITY_DN22476_c0_g1_i1.p1 TRINITY_DN22476_c0_g1~~TRINITY_DN22476_c0_g1_i1.p1  ORF type:complete len:140 (-),score=5.39 TRINITY_DN22476_c0_g1_i1:150-569(-)
MGKELMSTQSRTPKTKSMKLQKIEIPDPQNNTSSARSASKSVGHIDDSMDFQDWWSQSKNLPNTPSKSTKPTIRRSQSFCVRPDSSPWIRQPMRRNTTDPGNGWDAYYDDMDNMKLISLQNYVHDDDEDEAMKTIEIIQ